MSATQQQTDGVVSYSISVAGKALSSDYQVLRIEVTKQANRISHAKVEIRDGCVATGAFTASDSSLFNPGAEVSIAMGYQSENHPVFSGIISKQSIAIDEQGTSLLQLACKHAAVRMTNRRDNACYFDKKDSKIIETIAAKYDIAIKAEATKVTHQQMVQYYATDWDFILIRAQANGQLVFTENNALQISKPETSGKAALKLVYGDNILGFHAELNSNQQYPQILSRSWQSDQQKILEVKASAPETTATGDLSGKEIADDVNNESFTLQHGASVTKEDMQAWADAYWQTSAMSSIKGSVSVQGIARIKPGDLIELTGVGKHFNGKVWVNSVQQKMVRGNWITHLGFGLSGVWFGHKSDVHMPVNNGLLPAVKGLQIGTVSEVDQDPQEAYRVRVKLPLIDGDKEGVWARLGCTYAGKDYGCFFLPEVGDEVVLGFLDNDPRSPVILSALYSKKHPPAAEGKADEPQKYIITKNKLKLCFDDDNKIIHLETPGGCQFELNDKKKIILIKDSHDNQFKLFDGGINLVSKKNITLVSDSGDIKLKAKTISLNAQTDLKAEATNIKQTAKAQFQAKANAAAEVSATGNMTVKGAMVMIN